MLSVRHGAKAVEFYKQAFEARELFSLDGEHGDVVAQLAVGEADFWVADESPENKNFSPLATTGKLASRCSSQLTRQCHSDRPDVRRTRTSDFCHRCRVQDKTQPAAIGMLNPVHAAADP
jgi:hypothetical protein